MAIVRDITSEIRFELELSRSGEVENREITVPTGESIAADGTIPATLSTATAEVRRFLTTEDGNWLVQPTGWRDSDQTEGEWTTTACVVNYRSVVNAYDTGA